MHHYEYQIVARNRREIEGKKRKERWKETEEKEGKKTATLHSAWKKPRKEKKTKRKRTSKEALYLQHCHWVSSCWAIEEATTWNSHYSIEAFFLLFSFFDVFSFSVFFFLFLFFFCLFLFYFSFPWVEWVTYRYLGRGFGPGAVKKVSSELNLLFLMNLDNVS